MIKAKRISRIPNVVGADAGITQGFKKGGILATRDLKRSLTTGSRSGRVYVIGGKKHTASAAGEMPAKVSGELARSVGYEVGNKQLIIGEAAPHAGYLEDGTSKMEARKHLKPVVERNAAEIGRLLGQNVLLRVIK
jgi:HK97 gp10 family phage protein